MASLRTPPVPPDTTALLNPRAGEQAAVLARLLRPHARALEEAFRQRLQSDGFDARQRRAMSAVTIGAAARMRAQGRPLEDFLEQVGYNGRRLAKLDIPPEAVLAELVAYEELAGELIDASALEDLRRACERLRFAIVLTLNHAFYEVREAETRTFYALVEAELAARGQRELLQRSLDILAGFCQAEAGCLLAVDAARGTHLALACGAETPPEDRAVDWASLAAPRLIGSAAEAGRMLLIPEWARFESVWSVPLAGGGILGAMQFGFARPYEWLPGELKLLSLASERFLLASEKLRLAEDLAVREEQVRNLAAHMLEVEERERRRISRELHDEAGQLLLYLRLQLELIERLAPEEMTGIKSGLAGARELIDRALVEMRRLISDLSPAVLEQLGLAAAVRQFVNGFRRLHRIQTHLHAPKLGRLGKQTESVVYRLVQECLNNVARHASATHVNISLHAADGILKLRLEDDGVGFRVEEAMAKRDSFGLAGMRERVTLAGGEFAVVSRPGAGTAISVELPLRGAGSDGRACVEPAQGLSGEAHPAFLRAG